MSGEVLNTLAAVTLPSVSRRTVTAPPPSLTAMKLPELTSREYFCRSPGKPSGRVRKADGAANLTSAECAARSPIVFRFHAAAVVLVTLTVSVSDAGDGVRIDRSPGSRW